MALMYGSYGKKVSELQSALNMLGPTLLPLLTVDGKFGPKTQTRVREFQSNNKLVVDGVVGAATLAMIQQLLDLLNITPPPPASSVTVTSITQKVLGMAPQNGLIQQIFPAVSVISLATFQPGNPKNTFQFTGVGMATARIGIFAARNSAGHERSVILVVPNGVAPERVVLGVTHGFGQNAAYYNALKWSDPQSALLIQDVLLRMVVKRWGPQVLAATPARALLVIVRAAAGGGGELGPFAGDGAFTSEVLRQLAEQTQNAFSFTRVEAFTYSSGIGDFNKFLSSLAGHLTVNGVYNIDPSLGTSAGRPAGARVRQFLSGKTTNGGPRPGFEFMPYARWKNEIFFNLAPPNDFNYMHNFVLPQYTLHLGMIW